MKLIAKIFGILFGVVWIILGIIVIANSSNSLLMVGISLLIAGIWSCCLTIWIMGVEERVLRLEERIGKPDTPARDDEDTISDEEMDSLNPTPSDIEEANESDDE